MTNLPSVKPDSRMLVETFLSGRNSNTREAYLADLTHFAAHLHLTNPNEAIFYLVNCTQGQANLLVLEFRNALIERGLQSATINRRLSSVRAIVKLARMVGLITWSLEVHNIKSQSYRDTRGVGTSGVRLMLAELSRRNDARSLRDIAIIRLFFDLGLRVSEAVRLDISDLDFSLSTIEILGKARTQKEKLSLPEQTVVALKEWLAVRPRAETSALFLNFDRAKKGSGRITRFGVYKVIRGLGFDLNLKARPHGIRHDAVNAAIKAAQENEIELPSVLKFSRHQSLTTLQVYVDAVSNRQGEIAALVAGSLDKRRNR